VFLLLGLMAVNVVGVPVSLWFGQQFGWWVVYWFVVVVGVVIVIFVWCVVLYVVVHEGVSCR